MHECVVVIETEGSIKAGLQIKYELHPKILKVAIQNMFILQFYQAFWLVLAVMNHHISTLLCGTLKSQCYS